MGIQAIVILALQMWVLNNDIKHRETSLEDHARAGIRYTTESNPLAQLHLNTMADMG